MASSKAAGMVSLGILCANMVTVLKEGREERSKIYKKANQEIHLLESGFVRLAKSCLCGSGGGKKERLKG